MGFFDDDQDFREGSAAALAGLIVLVLNALGAAEQVGYDQVVEQRTVGVGEVEDRHVARLEQRVMVQGIRFWVVEDIETH